MNKQYWIIDTDTCGRTLGTHEAVGPYPTKQAAEKAALNDIRDFWDEACACLKKDCDKDNWCKPLLIVEVIRTVVPKITATIKLVDA